jgi:hypothetical protein
MSSTASATVRSPAACFKAAGCGTVCHRSSRAARSGRVGPRDSLAGCAVARRAAAGTLPADEAVPRPGLLWRAAQRPQAAPVWPARWS